MTVTCHLLVASILIQRQWWALKNILMGFASNMAHLLLAKKLPLPWLLRVCCTNWTNETHGNLLLSFARIRRASPSGQGARNLCHFLILEAAYLHYLLTQVIYPYVSDGVDDQIVIVSQLSWSCLGFKKVF